MHAVYHLCNILWVSSPKKQFGTKWSRSGGLHISHNMGSRENVLYQTWERPETEVHSLIGTVDGSHWCCQGRTAWLSPDTAVQTNSRDLDTSKKHQQQNPETTTIKKKKKWNCKGFLRSKKTPTSFSQEIKNTTKKADGRT